MIHIANLLFIEVVEILTSNSFDLFLEVVLSCFSLAADSLQPYGQYSLPGSSAENVLFKHTCPSGIVLRYSVKRDHPKYVTINSERIMVFVLLK